jgi:hypothetical protein
MLNKVKEVDKTKTSQLMNVNLMMKYSNKFHLNQISSIDMGIPKINKIQWFLQRLLYHNILLI